MPISLPAPIRPEAVILDFDGTLADTETMWPEIWGETARCHGREIPPEVLAETPGRPNRFIVVDLFPDLPPESRQAILDDANAAGKARILAGLRPVPGAAEFLAWARGRFRLALATNSNRRYVDELTARLGWTGLFDPVVCGDGAFRPKPEPDIYLETLRLLTLPASRCVVVEDSLVGVRAARAAGLAAVGLAGSFPAARLAALTPLVAEGWADVRRMLGGE
jgi:HAD superfamily hydrolase (TIGR01509 family)